MVDVHIKSGNTPTLRLEQDGSSGFTPQTWDVAGNEANFFVRDATNGSTLPFRIFPGAPSNALNIEASTGDVGLGDTSPDASLDVQRSDGTASILVEDTDTGAAERTMLDLINAGSGATSLMIENSAQEWQFIVQDFRQLRLCADGKRVRFHHECRNGELRDRRRLRGADQRHVKRPRLRF